MIAALALIQPQADVCSAWSSVFNAVALVEQNESDPWKINSLNVQEVYKYADGSVHVPQLGHRLFINLNGAFGIKDLWSDEIVVAVAGANGIPFYLPQKP
jgi:hypothetical protein